MFTEDASMQAFVASAGMRDSCGSERLHVAASATVVNSLMQVIDTEHMFDNFAFLNGGSPSLTRQFYSSVHFHSETAQQGPEPEPDESGASKSRI